MKGPLPDLCQSVSIQWVVWIRYLEYEHLWPLSIQVDWHHCEQGAAS